MKTSTRNEPNDHDGGQPVGSRSTVQGTAKAVIRCRLCRETIELESNFRPTAAECPHCGLKFIFDPQEEPLPVRGLKLRYADVLEAQRGRKTVQHRLHDAHVQPKVALPRPHTHYLAWLGGIALAAAAATAIFGGWFHRLLGR